MEAVDELPRARKELTHNGLRAAERFMELLVAADKRGGESRSRAHAEVAALRPKDWLGIDLVSRRRWWSFPSWWRAASDLASSSGSSICVLVSSFHPDGRVREAATALLVDRDDVLFAPALALRCGDWVPEVRDLARRGFERRMRDDLPGTLYSAGDVALLVSRRRTGSWLNDATIEHLRLAPDDEIDALVRSAHPLIKRAARTVAVERNQYRVEELVAMTAREGDLPSRLICGKAAIARAQRAGDLDTLRTIAADRSVQLRQTALTALDDLGRTDDVVASLDDRAGSVRLVTQHIVRSHGIDPADVYRSRLSDAGQAAAWSIAGLGETGTRDDRGIVISFLGDPRPRVRAEAIRALRRLGSDDPSALVRFLSDPSPTVAKQATAALVPQARQLDTDLLRRLLDGGAFAHTRRGAYRLLRAQDPWTRLATNLDLVDSSSPELHQQALTDIGGWLTNEAASTYLAPTTEQASRLSAAIEAHADSLGPRNTQLLRFHVRGDTDRTPSAP